MPTRIPIHAARMRALGKTLIRAAPAGVLFLLRGITAVAELSVRKPLQSQLLPQPLNMVLFPDDHMSGGPASVSVVCRAQSPWVFLCHSHLNPRYVEQGAGDIASVTGIPAADSRPLLRNMPDASQLGPRDIVTYPRTGSYIGISRTRCAFEIPARGLWLSSWEHRHQWMTALIA